MTRLRSPSVHHLDLNPRSLSYFASRRRRRRRENKPFAGVYDRPSLALFNAHSDHVLKTFGLPDLHIQDRATEGSVDCDGVEITLSSGRKIATRNVVLAVGGGEQPEWPNWASSNVWCTPRVRSQLRRLAVDDGDGSGPGGGSAAQTALRLKSEGHRVHMVSRHALREHRFDSAPGWLGPKYMVGFNREKDPARRRAIITEARHRGSVPREVRIALCGAAARNQVHWHKGEVEALDRQRDALALRLKTHELQMSTVFCSRPVSQLCAPADR